MDGLVFLTGKRTPLRISTKYCTAIKVVDLITCDKFVSNWLRNVVYSVRVKNRVPSLTYIRQWLFPNATDPLVVSPRAASG